HGLVDYLYILQKKVVNKFYVVFAGNYQKFLDKRNISSINVQGYFEKEDMLIGFPVPKIEIDITKNGAYTKCAMILLDSSEIFNVPDVFWIRFLERCITEIKDAEKYNIIIKPHPGQSNETLALVSDFCKGKNNITLLSDPLQVSMSFESIYISNRDKVDYIFSTYSAAELYLANFFDEGTKFCFLHEFIKPYYIKGPKQYADAFTELEPYINEVFSSKACKFLS
ncbi:MAG TPA: polysialyltransferase family glycosyltransferase, partial [Bacteroidia bacterium]